MSNQNITTRLVGRAKLVEYEMAGLVKVHEPQLPFLPLIQAAQEIIKGSESTKDYLKREEYVSYLRRELLPSFTKPMLERLVETLINQGYLERRSDERQLRLTDWALRALREEKIWTTYRMLARIVSWDDRDMQEELLGKYEGPIPLLLLKIKRGSDQKDAQLQSIEQKVALKKEYLYIDPDSEKPNPRSAIIEEVNQLYKVREEKGPIFFSLEPDKSLLGLKIKNEDILIPSWFLPMPSLSLAYLQKKVLQETYPESYDPEKDFLFQSFDVNNLNFYTDKQLDKVKLFREDFRVEPPMKISVQIRPKTREDAEKWRLYFVARRLERDIRGESDWESWQNENLTPIYEVYPDLKGWTRKEAMEALANLPNKEGYRAFYALHAPLYLIPKTK